MERLGLSLGAFERHKLVTQLIPRIDAPAGTEFSIRIGTQNFFDDPISWQDPEPYIVGTSRGINSIADGRYLSFQIYADTTNAWRLYSYAIKVAEVGQY